ncbi:MAG: site-specific integrase [Proteobacteria bacterium]|nr:site-specific integrase [Pseudomonadota bacterium]
MSRSFTRLTRSAVRQLAPGQRISEHGINIRRLRNGDIHYSVNIMVDGQRIHRVLGKESDGVTRTQCEEFIAKARTDARMKRLSLPHGRKIAMTFAKSADLYIKMLKESGGRRMTEKEQHLRLHLRPHLGRIPINQITTFTLENLRRKMRDAKLAEGTINSVFATYRHLGNKLHEWGKIDAPLPMFKLKRVENRRDYVLSVDEKSRLFDAALNDSNTHIWLFLQVGLHTSLRHAEILSLRFEDFEYPRRRIGVRVKGGDWREQPLTPSLADIIESERNMVDENQEWVFPNPKSRSGHTERMTSSFRRCALRAGIDARKVTPHILRHTAITDLSDTGAGPRTIQRFSGHKSAEMVWRYTHARENNVDEALSALDVDTRPAPKVLSGSEPRTSVKK